MIRAKFRVVEKINRANYTQGGPPTCHVKLSAANDPGNKSWAQYTPSGSIEMQIDNPGAYEAFELGRHYLVEFTPAPAAEADEKPAS